MLVFMQPLNFCVCSHCIGFISYRKTSSSPQQIRNETNNLGTIWEIASFGTSNILACRPRTAGTGFRSKRHMKLVLNWMKERQRVRVICEHLPELAGLHGDKEFFYAACPSKQVDVEGRQDNK